MEQDRRIGCGGTAGSYVSGRSAAGPGTGAPTEPTILSVYPLGARAGSTLEVEVQGNLLEGARAVWFAQGQLQGRVEDIRPVSSEETTDAEAAGGDTPVLLGVPDPAGDPFHRPYRRPSISTGFPAWSFQCLDVSDKLRCRPGRDQPTSSDTLDSPAGHHSSGGQRPDLPRRGGRLLCL